MYSSANGTIAPFGHGHHTTTALELPNYTGLFTGEAVIERSAFTSFMTSSAEV